MWKGQGTATAKGFVLVLLVENIVRNPNHPLSPKIGDLIRKGKSAEKKMQVKKGIKSVAGEKRVAVDKRKQW